MGIQAPAQAAQLLVEVELSKILNRSHLKQNYEFSCSTLIIYPIKNY